MSSAAAAVIIANIPPQRSHEREPNESFLVELSGLANDNIAELRDDDLGPIAALIVQDPVDWPAVEVAFGGLDVPRPYTQQS